MFLPPALIASAWATDATEQAQVLADISALDATRRWVSLAEIVALTIPPRMRHAQAVEAAKPILLTVLSLFPGGILFPHERLTHFQATLFDACASLPRFSWIPGDDRLYHVVNIRAEGALSDPAPFAPERCAIPAG